MKNVYYLSLILAIVGSINWGLIGIAEFDLVAALFGPATVISRVVYSLVGLAGINLLISTFLSDTTTVK